MYNRQNVVGEEFDGHRQKDNPKELPQHIDDIGAQPSADFIEIAQHDVVDDDVDGQADHDVHGGLSCIERDKGGDGSGSGNEREGDGNDAGTRRGGLVFDDVAP